jgi:2-oxoglutarate dehydrogenase E2 component (dihydrolipoamide succinyltransferase)
MAVDIKVPSVGESISEGTLARWLKKDGDAVRADEPLFELETEKATTEVAAPAAGVLHVTVPEGQTVAIGATVGRIEPDAAPAAPATRGQRPAAVGARAEPVAAAPKAAAVDGSAPPAGEVLLSPAARVLAEQEGLDVRQIKGSGQGGRITKEDVITYLEQRRLAPPAERRPEPAPPPAPGAGLPTPPKPPTALGAGLPTPPKPPTEGLPAPSPTATPPPGADGRETRQRMSAIRQRIADRLVAAKNTTAMLTTFNEVDMSAVMALRAKYKDTFKEKHGVGLGFMSFFIKACVEALHAYPAVNARIDGPEIVYQHFYDIGVAVSTEKGLMVPVVRGADRLGFAEIEKQIAALAGKARDGKISVTDLQGGTFTITNGGVFGSLLSTPILNAPQTAILGMHAIQKRPVAVNDEVVIRPMMYVALSYDHRLIDGREAVLFLVRVKECVESPERLLLEV